MIKQTQTQETHLLEVHGHVARQSQLLRPVRAEDLHVYVQRVAALVQRVRVRQRLHLALLDVVAAGRVQFEIIFRID